MTTSAPPSPTGLALADRALRFDRDHARRLRALAYRMLGSRTDAEDMVQETWLRWADVDEAVVADTGAYLWRLTTNLCLDKLRSAAAQRERYVGVWLPEPLVEDELLFARVPGPEQQAEFAQDVSVAFMLALDRLSPLERAAFLLHDVFDMDYGEIAGHLQRSEVACRQLVSRARQRVKADYTRHEVAAEERQRLAEAFIHAVRHGDAGALAQMLAEDAVLLSDGGGKVSAVPRPLHGGARIAGIFIRFAQLPASRGWRLVPAVVNGLPGCLVLDDGGGDGDGARLVQTIALGPSPRQPGRIAAMYVQRNPDKLTSASRWLAAQPPPHVTSGRQDPSYG